MSLFRKEKTGKKKTKEEIINLLTKVKKPVDANFLVEKIKSHRATIFRTLNKLVEEGVIKRVDFEEGKARYEVEKIHHHHLICKKCKKISAVSLCNLDIISEEIKKRTGFFVSDHRLEFFGLCKSCN